MTRDELIDKLEIAFDDLEEGGGCSFDWNGYCPTCVALRAAFDYVIEEYVELHQG